MLSLHMIIQTYNTITYISMEGYGVTIGIFDVGGAVWLSLDENLISRVLETWVYFWNITKIINAKFVHFHPNSFLNLIWLLTNTIWPSIC